MRDSLEGLSIAVNQSYDYQAQLNPAKVLVQGESARVTNHLDSYIGSLLGLPVTITGGWTPQEILDPDEMKLDLEWGPNNRGVQGTYNGFYVCETELLRRYGFGRFVICHHVLTTPNAVQTLDEFGGVVSKRAGQFVTTVASEVSVHGVINAHSLSELQGDDICQSIDQLIFNDDVVAEELIGRLASLFRRTKKNRGHLSREADRKRLSYLNGLSILESFSGLYSDAVYRLDGSTVDSRGFNMQDIGYFDHFKRYVNVRGRKILHPEEGLFIVGWDRDGGEIILDCAEPVVVEHA